MNTALAELSPRFNALHAFGGRPSMAPEKLLRALLLQAFYGVRSERQLMEQITYNMLFRWFVGLFMDAPIWDVTVFDPEPRPAACGRRSRLVPAGSDGRPGRRAAAVLRALLR